MNFPNFYILNTVQQTNASPPVWLSRSLDADMNWLFSSHIYFISLFFYFIIYSYFGCVVVWNRRLSSEFIIFVVVLLK